MPFPRPTLSQLKSQVASDIASALPGSDPLLRFSNLKITGVAQANLANDQYGYLDFIAQQSVPFTATGENAYGWGAFKGVVPKSALPANNGQVTFTGTNGAVIADQTPLQRGDGASFTVQGAVTVTDGVALVNAAANIAGSAGNTDVNSIMTLGTSIDGVNSSGTVSLAFTNGEDDEEFADFKTRMLAAYSKPPQGGALQDYINWALSAPGVTRAWCKPLGMGPGTVVLYVMLDAIEAAHGGFPQGTDGCAASETRSAPAAGDQLVVANFVFPLRPIQSLVYVVAPVPTAINFTVSGISAAPDSVKAAIAAAFAGVCTQNQVLAGVTQINGVDTYVVPLQPFEAALAAVPGAAGALLTAPAGNITLSIGHLPVVGTITYD